MGHGLEPRTTIPRQRAPGRENTEFGTGEERKARNVGPPPPPFGPSPHFFWVCPSSLTSMKKQSKTDQTTKRLNCQSRIGQSRVQPSFRPNSIDLSLHLHKLVFRSGFRATAPFQCALSALAGKECVVLALQSLTEESQIATVMSIDRIGAFDLISRKWCRLLGCFVGQRQLVCGKMARELSITRIKGKEDDRRTP